MIFIFLIPIIIGVIEAFQDSGAFHSYPSYMQPVSHGGLNLLPLDFWHLAKWITEILIYVNLYFYKPIFGYWDSLIFIALWRGSFSVTWAILKAVKT